MGLYIGDTNKEYTMFITRYTVPPTNTIIKYRSGNEKALKGNYNIKQIKGPACRLALRAIIYAMLEI